MLSKFWNGIQVSANNETIGKANVLFQMLKVNIEETNNG